MNTSTAKEKRDEILTAPGRGIRQDYHGKNLSIGDIVEHVLDGGMYRVTRMIRKSDSVLVEPISGSKRNGFNLVPCECLRLANRIGE